MKSFKDGEGRSWIVAINVTAIKRVKALAGVDLMKAIEGELIGQLIEDPILLADAIYAVCQPQADARDISADQFGEALAGDTIDAATTALLEDLVDFFPQAKRGPLRKTVAKFAMLQTEAMQAIEAKLDDPALLAGIRSDLKRRLETLGTSSTTAPESSASTPEA